MAESNEVVVVGAGLAGLTAALNLAREGKEVLVLEKYDRVGGIPEAHPACDVTPMQPGPLGRFIGVDLGEPQISSCQGWNVYAYDQLVEMDLTYVNLHCVERGSAKSALDIQLYNLCLDAGVKFEFDKRLVSQGDFAELPPDSIIATGLYFEAFEALHIPYEKVFGYIGRGKTDKWPNCGVWFHDYALDYAYYGSNNGIVFSLYFNREPVRDDEFERFKEKQLLGQEGMVCSVWDYHEGLVPTAAYNNPKMFAGDKILAGTLGGMMDPFALFGVHGSLVSGKLAAMAHSDKAAANDLFKKYTRYFNRNLFMKRRFDSTPEAFQRKMLGPQLQFLQDHSAAFVKPMDWFWKALPGYTELPK